MFGLEHQDGVTILHEMLYIPEEMEKYVSDYKMILIEARKNDIVERLQNKLNISLQMAQEYLSRFGKQTV